MSQRPSVAGFTLIEVLVALVIVAFGIGALLTTLTSAADSLTHLRDKSFAEWIALNRISEVRLAAGVPAVGKTAGDLDYANTHWHWAQEVSDPGIAGIRRIEVAVSRVAAAPAPKAGKTETSREAPALATAYGFAGLAIAPPSGIDPDWSLASAPNVGAAPNGGAAPKANP